MKRSLVPILILMVLLALPVHSYAQDTTPPETTITSGPSGVIGSREVTFEWSGSDDGTATSDLTYSYKLEGQDGSWSNWTYDTSKTYTLQRNGDYTFKVKARDEDLNVDPTPAMENFTLQTTEPGMNKWSFDAGGSVISSPAIGSDGTIYVGSSDHNLYAVNPDGTEKWSFKTGDRITSSPAIGSDGTIYGGSSDGNLYAINPNGTKKWSFETEDEIESSPAIGFDRTIYVGSNDRKLYSINPNGTEKWSFETEERISFSPAIGPNGTIYVVSGRTFYAISPDGKKRWTFEFDRWTSSNRTAPTISSDGTIYVASGQLHAINPDGTEKWSFDNTKDIWSSPVISSDGVIYVCSSDRHLYAISTDGSEKWRYKTGREERGSSPAIGSDGTIYVGSDDFNLYAINPDGTKKWSFKTKDRVYSSPAIGSDGTVYFGSEDRKLYAIYGESGGLADTAWPMFQRDLRHTGRLSDVDLHFDLNVTIEGEGSVEIEPDKEDYAPGTEVDLTAVPDQNRYFKEWTGDYNGTREEITITMNYDKEITAVFGSQPGVTRCFPVSRGWNLISLPLEPNDTAPEAVFDELPEGELYLWGYDNKSGNWLTTHQDGDLSSVNSLGGYYLWLPNYGIREICTTGEPLTGNQSIDLPNAGWQLIGVPYAVEWGDDGTIGVSDGTDNYTLPEAVNAGWLNNQIWEYDYRLQRFETSAASDRKALNPDKGYWVFTQIDNLTMTLSDIVDPGNPPAPSAAAINLENVKEVVSSPPVPVEPSGGFSVDALKVNAVRHEGTVTFQVSGESATFVNEIEVEVFDAGGREVRTLESVGSTVDWSATSVPNGVYLYGVSVQIDGDNRPLGMHKLLILQ